MTQAVIREVRKDSQNIAYQFHTLFSIRPPFQKSSKPPGTIPGHTITVAYTAFVPSRACGVKAGDDAAEADWFSIDDLPSLAFDHEKIIKETYQRIVVAPSDSVTEQAHEGYAVVERGSGKILLDGLKETDAKVVKNTRPNLN